MYTTMYTNSYTLCIVFYERERVYILTQIHIQYALYLMREREKERDTYALAMPNAFVRTASTLVELT